VTEDGFEQLQQLVPMTLLEESPSRVA
jgi:hypothetical protein